MITIQALQPALDVIYEHMPKDFKPKAGLILGSGLGPLADEIEDSMVFPYEQLPGLPISSVHGHAGSLVLGYLKGTPVACLKGRVHYYEGANGSDFKILIRLLKALGCHSLFITNASGSLRAEIGAGELVAVSDHINFQFNNPLIGHNEKEFGDRFFPLDQAYDQGLRDKIQAASKALDVKVHEGIYISVLGPNFETPAEIRAYRMLGADLVGMSTVPEVLVAAHCGMKVAVISAVTNLSADINPEPITHEVTLKYGEMASKKLRAVIRKLFEMNRDAF